MVGATNDVWLVTGASKGIGREVVEHAVREGARVIAGSREPAAVETWAQEAGIGDQVLALTLDVTSAESIDAAVAAGVERFGPIDVLVNNAGYLLQGAVEELSDEEVRRSFGINVFGLLNVTRAVLAVMRGEGSGRIINMSSISANVTSPGTGLYSATKAAVLMFSDALDQEARGLGIRTTAVCPGGVRTDFLDASSARSAERSIDDYDVVRRALDSLGRANHRQGGDPRLVAEAIFRLAQLDDPPARLYLGRDALAAIIQHEQQVLADVAVHRELSESTWN